MAAIVEVRVLLWLVMMVVYVPTLIGQEPTTSIVIEPSMVHLRSGNQREWDRFPESAGANELQRDFIATRNAGPGTLTLRQQDVKQGWQVRLNDQRLGDLIRDENDMEVDFVVPAGCLRDGDNHLQIWSQGSESDDIRIGQIKIDLDSIDARRTQARVDVLLVDSHGDPLPGRITIMNDEGTLIPCRVDHTEDQRDRFAVRQGVVYTIDGTAILKLATGRYRIVATRGFEYELAEHSLDLIAGQHDRITMALDRVVDTAGWVACDTHVHTVTHSGHGDCTIKERMVTLAGEGIELAIATDHNKAIDYRPQAQSVGADTYFTPVIGNECTTPKGHFNLFPLEKDAPLPNHAQEDWGQLSADIQSTTRAPVVILNHARDLHSGFRPFSPSHHIGLIGQRVDDRPMAFNAMEVLNSGAVQTDGLQLFHDWCGLINRGLQITPVGCSDSHDVARFIVGQGRTYIRCDDSDPSRIAIDDAIAAMLQGRVIVSYGLLVRLSIDERFEPGDVMTLPRDSLHVTVSAEVHGPAWTRADSIALYIGGHEAFRHSINPDAAGGTSLKARVSWTIPRTRFRHDTWLTAVATGPGIQEGYWKTALPYQPTSIHFVPYVFSSTGPIRIDSDGDGVASSAFANAQSLVDRLGSDQRAMLDELQHCDESVIHQVAALMQTSGEDLADWKSQAGQAVAEAIADYQRVYNNSIIAKLEGLE